MQLGLWELPIGDLRQFADLVDHDYFLDLPQIRILGESLKGCLEGARISPENVDASLPCSPKNRNSANPK